MHQAKILHDNQQNRSMYHRHRRLQHQVHVFLLKNNELMKVTKDKNEKKGINHKKKKVLVVELWMINEIEAFYRFRD